MYFAGDANGVHLVGDWDTEATFSAGLLGYAAGHGTVRTTIKVQLAEGWALYRVTGVSPKGDLVAKRIRRGRGAAA
jgi:hypothetical protein